MLIFLALISSVFSYQECIQAKSSGTQKDFCESKLLSSNGSAATISCFVNFCDYCCQSYSSSDCLNLCRSTHVASNVKNDPEEIFIKVCSSEKMKEAMKPYCEKYNSIEEDKLKCYNSFCYDCCSGELKINSETDTEMQKCIKFCSKNIQGEKEKKNCSEDESNKFCTKFFDPNSNDKRLHTIHSCLENFCDLCCDGNGECTSHCGVQKVEENAKIEEAPKESINIPSVVTSACYEFIDDFIEMNRCQYNICYEYCKNDITCTKACLKAAEKNEGNEKIAKIIEIKINLESSKIQAEFDLEGPIDIKISKIKQEIEKFKHILLKAQKELNSLQKQKLLGLSKEVDEAI
ncbi:unnamed protein product [Blepharisma stoltei]|uniref:Uncharacterized protein n=1 Tax=Blepharisma stoltei TaxID=1481888 RepID=A0AAU9J6V2_9CILI|nr:unnamed protein product [Blepharisma stoltei]